MATPDDKGRRKGGGEHYSEEKDETPSSLYGGQLSNTIGISHPMKKYIDTRGSSVGQSNQSFKVSANPYQNSVRNAGHKFQVQDADQIIEESFQNTTSLTEQSSLANLSHKEGKNKHND